MFPQKSPFCPLFGAFYPHFAIHSTLRAAGASRYPPLKERVATFALVTTVGPQPRPARSTPGEPGRAADRQAFAAWFKRRSQLRGAWGSTPEGRRPQIRGWRWGLAGCLQPDPSHPALVTREDPGVEPCRSWASLSYPTDRQVLRNPHVGRPGFLAGHRGPGHRGQTDLEFFPGHRGPGASGSDRFRIFCCMRHGTMIQWGDGKTIEDPVFRCHLSCHGTG